jgi:hypothetical protein
MEVETIADIPLPPAKVTETVPAVSEVPSKEKTAKLVKEIRVPKLSLGAKLIKKQEMARLLPYHIR